jgi:hypothetical protein
MPKLNANNAILILFVLLSLFLAGCKTRKSVENTALVMESMEMFSSSPSVVQPRTSLSGNLRLTINIDGKPLSAKGTLRIKEECGVQIGMTALGVVEVASLEFLPENLRIIYKLGKEYTEIPYSDLSFLQQTGIDYRLLESVLMNRAFSPDGRPFVQAMNEMSYAVEGDCITATTRETKGIVYKFYLDKATGELVQSEGVHAGGGKVVCSYSDFRTVDGVTFPHTILLSIYGVGSDVSLQFALERVDMDDFKFTPRRISSSYGKLNAQRILKSLGNM